VELGLSFPATRSQLGLRDDVASNPGKFQAACATGDVRPVFEIAKALARSVGTADDRKDADDWRYVRRLASVAPVRARIARPPAQPVDGWSCLLAARI